jgi:hypothetical protein
MNGLQFFDVQVGACDDDVHTWDIMTSVPPHRLPHAWGELSMLLTELSVCCPLGPGALDEGCDWDAQLSVAFDHQTAHTVPLIEGQTCPPAPAMLSCDIQWVEVTLTLACRTTQASAVSAIWEDE